MGFFKATAAAFLVVGGLASVAEASITLGSGVLGGSGDVQNVVFNHYPGQSGLSVFGDLNSTSETVQFTSDEDLVTPSGGQARVEAQDGALQYIEFELIDSPFLFSKVQFNIDIAGTGNPSPSPQALITLFDQNNVAHDFTVDLGVSGANWFTGNGTDGDLISKVVIDSNTDFIIASDIEELLQVRLGPASGVVPEASSLLVWGGLALTGLCLCRRKLVS